MAMATTRTMTPTRTSRTGTAEARPTPGAADGDCAASPVPLLSGGRQDDAVSIGGAALCKLAIWLSPGYPVGAFAYSHGLETTVAGGEVHDRASAAAWIGDCIELGAGRSDAILLAHAWRAERAGDAPALEALAELALALAPSAERRLETEAQGAAFADITAAAWGGELRAAPYPVVVGRAAAQHGVPLPATLLLFLQALASTLVSACVRLVPIGQTDGQRALAALMPLCGRVAGEATDSDLEAVGGCAFRADIAAMRHESQAVRLFRT
jgi:urease accessory protein